MAVVAQLVEPRVVISVVVGSSPISRPILFFCIPPFYILSLYQNLLKTDAAILGIFLCLSMLYPFASVYVGTASKKN